MRTALCNNVMIQNSRICRFYVLPFFYCTYYYTYTVASLQVIYFMLTIRPTLKTKHANAVHISRRALSTVLMGSVLMLSLSGCGQKGDLYLTDASNQTIQSSAVLESTSHPQDAAFAGIDDDNYQTITDGQKSSDFVLPEPSSDPNDY